MRTSSAKAKGRRGSQRLVDALLVTFPELTAEDIRVVPSSVTGEDLWLSPKAREKLPFTFEVKNQEALNIWASLKQAEGHANGKPLTPILAFQRNHSEMYVAMKLSDFVKIIQQ